MALLLAQVLLRRRNECAFSQLAHKACIALLRHVLRWAA